MNDWRKMRKGWWLHVPSGREFVQMSFSRRWYLLRNPEVQATTRKACVEKARVKGLM